MLKGVCGHIMAFLPCLGPFLPWVTWNLLALYPCWDNWRQRKASVANGQPKEVEMATFMLDNVPLPPAQMSLQWIFISSEEMFNKCRVSGWTLASGQLGWCCWVASGSRWGYDDDFPFWLNVETGRAWCRYAFMGLKLIPREKFLKSYFPVKRKWHNTCGQNRLK